jgi:hypothetical protein
LNGAPPEGESVVEIWLLLLAKEAAAWACFLAAVMVVVVSSLPRK